MKRFIAAARPVALGAWLLLLLCRNASGQIAVSDYASLLTALQTSTVITNFVSNSIITLSTVGQTIQITTNVLIDGGTNNIVIDGSSATRLFYVHPKCQLILNNLQLLNGIAVVGGGIFNEGTLIISNCIIAGNSATNINGINGTANTSGGNGSGASSGGSAQGGAIYSTGPLSMYYSVIGTNAASGGSGGMGGNGGPSLLFGGNGGNGGAGGSAQGAAIFSTGSTNIFYYDQFIDNQCTAGPGGGGGSAGSGAFDPGNSGQGGIGGSADGGALCIEGNVTIYGCLFYLNSVTGGASAGAEVEFDGSGSQGSVGGSAVGGGVFVSSAAAQCDVENTVFFNNTCTAGKGGDASGQSADGGNGGTAIGGGMNSAAVRATVRCCTLATNTLKAGAKGTGSGSNGSVGGRAGWDLCVTAGALRLSDSILSGGTNAAPNDMPNAYGVIDAGYNVCSDASLVKQSTTTLLDADTGLDSGLADDGGPTLGPADIAGPVMLTLAVLEGPAIGFIPGIAGITYPETDEIGQLRGSPASAGAYEVAPITDSTNLPLPKILRQPAGSTNDPGSTAVFTVSAVSGSAFGYQWQLNGTNLIDNATFEGVTTSNLTVKKASLAQQGPYQVILGVSLVLGVQTSSVANLIIVAPPKITVQPARIPAEPDGAIVTLKVTATGAEPLSYQWRNGTTNLADGNGISGSETNALVLDPATFSDAGKYTVVISNAFGAVTSAAVAVSIVADKTKPTVAITSPAAGARTTNALILGSAADNAQVTGVFWWLTNVNNGIVTVTSNLATLSTNGTTTRTWSITNAVAAPGSNIVAVRSVDYAGNPSVIATRKFFVTSPAAFTLDVSGPGKVTGRAAIAGTTLPTNGAMLNIGEGYTLTETPQKHALFENWSSNGVIVSSAPTLRFIMEPGLAIAAVFASNTVVHADSVYNGLFYDPSNGVTEKTAGMLSQLTVDSTGAYSGKLLLAGGSYAIAGRFDASGTANNLIARSEPEGGAVRIRMSLQGDNDRIDGEVSGAAWTSALFAEAADTNVTSGSYALLLLPSTNAAGEVPQGSGHLLLTNGFGWLAYRAELADGSVVSQATPIGRLGDVALFANLYGSNGLVLGWLDLTNGGLQAETPLAWIRLPSNAGLYTNGFTNLLSVIASDWTNQPPERPSPDEKRR